MSATLPLRRETDESGDVSRHPQITDIRDLLAFRIAMLAATNDRVAQSWLKDDFGLRILEWRTLGLTAALEPVRFGTLARRLLIDKGQLSRLVKVLAARGLLRSAPDEDDQRKVRISVTEAGRALHDKVLKKAFDRNDIIVSAMTREETETLFRLLAKLQPLMDQRVDEVENRASGKRAAGSRQANRHEKTQQGGK